jgi:hypothetical protein
MHLVKLIDLYLALPPYYVQERIYLCFCIPTTEKKHSNGINHPKKGPNGEILGWRCNTGNFLFSGNRHKE